MTEPQDGQVESLLDFIRDSRGFDFTGYKRSSLMRRIGKRMEAIGIKSYVDYQDYLEVHQEEFTSLFNYILINVTAFFRDPQVWDFLAAETVPRVLEQKSDPEPIRVWCAGVASGEEAYSAAILLADAMGREGFQQRVKIYATDLDDEALAQARLASYPERAVEPIPPQLLEQYFERNGSSFTFDRDLRRAVIFGRHDLVQDAPISKVDLLICRNTLMYFNADTQSKVMAHFHFALNEGGFLVLGKAEMLFTHVKAFLPVDLKRRVFTKVDVNNDARERLMLMTQAGEVAAAGQLANHVRGRELAFDAAPIAQILVDRNGFVVLANQRARDLFGLAPSDLGRPLQDLEISYRPVELRSKIEQSGRERRTVTVDGTSWSTPAGDNVLLDVEVTPLQDLGGRQLGVSVTFTDVSRFRELQEALENSNQELETAMEELQSTNEELETTNEELQSTNEELETMNEELQSTNEELQTVNEEFRERSTELDQLNAFLEGILSSVRAGVVVLDRMERVRTWNSEAQDMWGLRQEEVLGQRLDELDIGLPVNELKDQINRCLAGEGNLGEVVLEATNRRGRVITCRVGCSPYRDGQGSVQGAIVMIEEVTGGR